MIRGVVMLIGLVGAVCPAVARDEDPVKEKLLAAKVAYDGEMREYRKQAGEWFDKREDAARKDGNKKALDQIKDERKTFDAIGEVPKGAPPAVWQKPALARKALEAAHTEAVKEYVRAKKDDEAVAVEAAWKTFVKERALDLLALVDPKVHAAAGKWKKEGKALFGENSAQLQLPYEPGEEYDLEVTCRRLAGNNAINVGLVVGGRQVAAVVDGWPNEGHRSGFYFVDKKSGLDNVTTVKGQLLKGDQDHTLVYAVRSGKIDLSINGKITTSFKGNFARLSLGEGWGVPNKKALFLDIGAGNSVQFSRIAVTPVTGKGNSTK